MKSVLIERINTRPVLAISFWLFCFALGWRVKRQNGSHKVLERAGWPDYVFAFHDGEETALACYPESPDIQACGLTIYSPQSSYFSPSQADEN